MHPELAHIGPVSIKSYGFMLMLAFVVSMLWCLRTARRKGFSTDQVIDLSLLILILGVVGSRIVFVLLRMDAYRSSPEDVLKVWEGGLSFHGGVLGAVLGGLWFARRTRRSFWDVADLVTPSIPLGYAIAKWGCFLNGCCAGGPTNLPWAMRFPVEGSGLRVLGPPSHPVQIYDSLLSLLIFAAIDVLGPRLRVSGHLFLAYLSLYSVSRIATEALRKGVTAHVLFDGVTEAQAASAAIIVFAAIAASRLSRRREAAGAEKQQPANGSQRSDRKEPAAADAQAPEPSRKRKRRR
jgi:phosphatidylglycerol:prolipoprotein diacylglycerol transferase